MIRVSQRYEVEIFGGLGSFAGSRSDRGVGALEAVERWVGHLDDADLQELIGELGMEDYAGLTGWVRCALYAEWARRDPKVALAGAELLPDLDVHNNYAVQQVLFSVLRGWAESDPKAALAERKRLVNREAMQRLHPLSPPVQKPDAEYVAAGAALALAEHDVEGAVTWLSTHGPGDDTDRRSRTYEMLSEWATAHPVEALKLIEEDRLQSYTGSLATAAIMGDPGIATAVMQGMGDHRERERAGALQDVHGLDSNHMLDFFPAPGLPNRLPNFQERYECLLEAVEAGNFRPGKEVSLLRSLYANFRHQVPDAQRAFEAMPEEN